MALFTLDNGSVSLVVSSLGGCIVKCTVSAEGREIPLLRSAPLNAATPAAQSGCFPLVPFGNRVNHNRFTFEQRDYTLEANTAWDRHYLHGDGWLNEWQCVEQRTDFLRLRYRQLAGLYRYRVDQCFSLRERGVDVELVVEHGGEKPMPYGLGWHPYFPLTPQTRVQAPATGYWLEGPEWLAGEQVALTPALDFNQPLMPPRRWVNNGFSGWNGEALIQWPERQAQLRMRTEPACPVYVMFLSDPAFDPGYQFDFFCLEPMTHAVNGHNLPKLGGLCRLAKGDVMSQKMMLSYAPL